jgi:Spy/CpxP family protein refolding chaperone
MGVLRGINLSDQQRIQIRQIVEQYRQGHPESAADPQAHKQMRNQIMNVLTPQQRSQVEQQLQQQRRNRATSTPQP